MALHTLDVAVNGKVLVDGVEIAGNEIRYYSSDAFESLALEDEAGTELFPVTGFADIDNGITGLPFADAAELFDFIQTYFKAPPVPDPGSYLFAAPLSETAGTVSIAAATTSDPGSMSGADKTKLDGIQASATANDTDANLKNRSNHTGTQTASTISDLGTAAVLNVPAAGNAAGGEVVKGNDTRLADSRTPTSHSHTSTDITDFAAAVASAMVASLATKADKIANVTTVAGTTYTLLSTDNAKIIRFTSASAVVLTVPAGLVAGFNCLLLQAGAGQVTIASGGPTINNRQGYTKTAGQWATATLLSAIADVFVSGGDMSSS